MVKAKSAGSFIGGLFNNPTFLILGALGIGLLFFQKDIRNAFGSLGTSLGNITLPDIQLPSLPDIQLPSLPDIQLPSLPDIQLPSLPDIQLPSLPSFTLPSFPDIQFPTLPTIPNPFDFLSNLFNPPTPIGQEPSDAELFASQGFDPPTGTFGDQTPLTPAQEFVSNLPQGFESFQTEGSSFVGAAINPVPIQNLSLSQIIDMFDVTASQAANIQAIAEDDFGDFDFGTNIGGIIPAQFGGSDVNVSSSQFEGLSASEIANILTGGNIQNF